ncbi:MULTISPECIES: carboxymuconolactone decarboxylase family protein [Rhodobacterales]|mgnify:FL=1|jgi:4-carboxymuconolactone decarboxylase|uniref:Carboxymuconolactone decarboxylase-like domain-containing protein n=1 Tax=Tritonibacter mobilis F1926 TaxID=1265309 RepID=A0A1B1A352_9RHOB|nr:MULTISPECIES: carboxymuconolactone decarboxylase family protein [Bacteria]EEW56740.1 carboxymuconolactone decarboxylase [Ruegeria sp. TrichCH4B]MCZ4268037.1 carboxymuconolactone decarboxylase family protein [Rhodobacteraceae bacterium G21628-S1]MEE2810527.1 carboxymuconolactone decarboxylase family protein [Pseudomonadota bacterium]NKX29846.1 carboxymuconolactone decarboxylase family protein [Rhodobacteraceae bacterium R_SAG6]NKX38054.1 carboxymuconolactone decarboxylase family protein [Rho
MSETPKNPFEAMMAQAQEMAKALNPALESFSPKGFEALWPTMPKEVMEMMFGNTVNKDGLDAKTRLLLTLAGLTMQGAQADTAVRQTVRHALAAGAKKQEIVETIGQMSVFAGIPAMTRAMDLAQEVMDDKGDDET